MIQYYITFSVTGEISKVTCILSSANQRSYSMDSIHSGYTLTHTDNRRHWNTYTFLNKVPVHTHVGDVHYGEELALCSGKVLQSKCFLRNVGFQSGTKMVEKDRKGKWVIWFRYKTMFIHLCTTMMLSSP